MPIAGLTRCTCGGFVPLTSTACPHCHAARPNYVRWGLGLAALAGGALTTVTLAACYGSGCVGEQCYGPPPDMGQSPADLSPADAGASDGGDAGAH